MKAVFTLLLSVFFLCAVHAQKDMGFRYLAVAMDAEGQILRNHEINLKITLVSDSDITTSYYEEEHRLVSNENGIISTTIGQGKGLSGSFKRIPWQSKNIWIRVSVDTDLDNDYDLENYAQLLAVPYALYALEAERLSDGKEVGSRNNSNDVFPYWTIDGNILEKQHNEGRLGTINDRDIIIITSDLERGRIYANGDAGFFYNVEIDLDLDVNGLARFNNVMESATKDDGSVVVEGGVGVEKNVNIGGNLSQDDLDDVATLGHVIVMDTTDSYSPSDGALKVIGGAGIQKNVNIGGDLAQDDEEDIATLGQVSVTNTTNSTAPDNGALTVDGGLGVAKDANIGGNVTIEGDITGSGLVIKEVTRTGSDANWGSYPVQIDAKEQGLAIKLDEPDAENNFITFFDENYEAVGRIEGQTKIDILESQAWIVETTFLSAAIASSLGSFASQAASGVNLALDVGRVMVDLVNHLLTITGAAFGSVEAGAGVGDLVCVSAIAVIDLAYSSVQVAGGVASNFVDLTVTAFDATTNVANFIQYQTLTFLNSGSTFSSGSADYAEYLPKLNASEIFSPGDVVAVVDGKITKDISKASQFMVVSSDPLVLGNMPLSGDEHLYEKVAFMGQVPVKVNGAVQSGDYLIADEANLSYAKAVSPNELTLEDVKKIVGISWGGSELKGTNYVNAAIGLNKNDVVPILENQVKEMDKLKVEINEIKKYISENEALLIELIPGYAEAKKGKSLDYDADLIAAVNDNILEATQASLYSQLEMQDLMGILKSYPRSNAGTSYMPIDHVQTMAMLNKIDTKHNLDLSLFAEQNGVGPLQDIEQIVTNILETDYVAEFKDAMEIAVAQSVKAVADQVLMVKNQMINDIALAGDFTPNEKMMLQEKINEILPIFGLLDDADQIAVDILNDIFDVIDAATCSICSELDKLPIQPEDIADAISIPANFFIETVDFFVGTLSTLHSTCFTVELCFFDVGCADITLCPFDFIPEINFNVDDMPFVEGRKLQIEFPDLCERIQCN